MADPPEKVDSPQPGGGASAGTPRWVKVLAVIGVVLALVVGVMLLVGGGEHGPGRHTGSDGTTPAHGTGGHTLRSEDGGHTPPPRGHAAPE